jgi:hypothetical protein
MIWGKGTELGGGGMLANLGPRFLTRPDSSHVLNVLCELLVAVDVHDGENFGLVSRLSILFYSSTMKRPT